jgi:hypothetical protein
MLIPPMLALLPHKVDPGLRMTSTRFTLARNRKRYSSGIIPERL